MTAHYLSLISSVRTLKEIGFYCGETQSWHSKLCSGSYVDHAKSFQFFKMWDLNIFKYLVLFWVSIRHVADRAIILRKHELLVITLVSKIECLIYNTHFAYISFVKISER